MYHLYCLYYNILYNYTLLLLYYYFHVTSPPSSKLWYILFYWYALKPITFSYWKGKRTFLLAQFCLLSGVTL